MKKRGLCANNPLFFALNIVASVTTKKGGAHGFSIAGHTNLSLDRNPGSCFYRRSQRKPTANFLS
ncbi:hypothetical protein, partial [Chlorobium limicola]|uniref:hypothetical protein n=1 Tax=Chlorobium limicola TaxID=1092 RepID=UPI001F365687